MAPNIQAECMSLPVVAGSGQTLPGPPTPHVLTCISRFPFPTSSSSQSSHPVRSLLPSLSSLKKVDQSLLCGASHHKLVADLRFGGPWDQGIFIFNKFPALHQVRALAFGDHSEPGIFLKNQIKKDTKERWFRGERFSTFTPLSFHLAIPTKIYLVG